MRGYEKPFYKWVAAHSDAYLRSPPTKKEEKKTHFILERIFVFEKKKKKEKKSACLCFHLPFNVSDAA